MTYRSALLLPCLTASLLLASQSSSSACPADASTPCIAVNTVSSDAPPAPRQPVFLATQATAVAQARAPQHEFVTLSPAALQPDAPSDPVGEAGEMPWIWKVLASEVYDRLPTVQDSAEYTAKLAPVIVTGTSNDTVPGVGMRGDF